MRRESMVGVLTLLMLAGAAPGQEVPAAPSQGPQPPASTDAQTESADDQPADGIPDPDPDDAATLLEQPPSSGLVYRAVGKGDGSAPIPGVVIPDARPDEGRLLPEGSYLLRRRGIVVPVGQDRWAFFFDRDADGHAEPPMYLMPSRQLSEMVGLVRSREETVTFFLDGEVFVFDEKNHLLPIRYDVGPEPEHSRSEEAQATIEANEALRPDDKDPSVESLMQRLDRATEPQEGASAVREARARAEQSDMLVPERTPVVSVRGRLVREDAGRRWAFLPDNDVAPKSEANSDADAAPAAATKAFILQPCLSTQELERLADREGDRVAFILSGAVFVFEGRNYLLPTMYLIETNVDGNLTPAQ